MYGISIRSKKSLVDSYVIYKTNINNFSVAVCGQMAARETTGEAIIISGLHSRSRVFISGGNRKLKDILKTHINFHFKKL